MAFNPKDYKTVDELVDKLADRDLFEKFFEVSNYGDTHKITRSLNTYDFTKSNVHGNAIFSIKDVTLQDAKYLPNDGEFIAIRCYVHRVIEVPTLSNTTVYLSSDPSKDNMALLEGKLHTNGSRENFLDVLNAIRNAQSEIRNSQGDGPKQGTNTNTQEVTIYGQFKYNQAYGSPLILIHGILDRGLLRVLNITNSNTIDAGQYL